MIEKMQNIDADTEYVYVEMALTGNRNKISTYEIISGLLKGIKTKDNSTYILLHGKKDATNIANLKFYNIMTIEVRHKEHKNMTHLTVKESDQRLAIKTLNAIYVGLLKNNFGANKDGSLVDIKKYINVPDEYYVNNLSSKPTHLSSKSTPDYSRALDRTPAYNTSYNRNNNIATRITGNVNVKKKLVPSIFSRLNGSKKPSKNQLSSMQKKIDLINSGKFKCNLPKTIEDLDGDKGTNLYEDPNMFWM